MNSEDVFDDINWQVSRFMAGLLQNFPKNENMIANVLADSLGGLIAIAAKDPPTTIEHICCRLKAYPVMTVRSEHMMAVQGIKDSQGRVRTPNLGVIQGKPK